MISLERDYMFKLWIANSLESCATMSLGSLNRERALPSIGTSP